MSARWNQYGRDDPSVWVPESNLGTLLLVENRSQEAEPLLLHAYGLLTRLNGVDDPGTIRMARKLANAEDRLGKTTEAQAISERHHLPADPLDWSPATQKAGP